MKLLATKREKTARSCVGTWKRYVETARVINNCNLIDSVLSVPETKKRKRGQPEQKDPKMDGIRVKKTRSVQNISWEE